MINLSPLLETVHCYLMTTFVCHSRQYPKVVHQNTDRYIEDGMGGESPLQLKKIKNKITLKNVLKSKVLGDVNTYSIKRIHTKKFW